MKLKSFTTKSGQTVILGKMTVFVGPNNSGKSQTLRDIRERMVDGQKSKPVIIDNFDFEIPTSVEECLEDIDVRDSNYNIAHKTISGLQYDLLSKDSRELYIDYITLNVPPVAFLNVPLQTWSHSVRQS